MTIPTPLSQLSRNLHLGALSRLSALLGLVAVFGPQESAVGAPLVSANSEAIYLGSETPAQTAPSGTVSDSDSGVGDGGEPRYGTNTSSASFGTLQANGHIGVLARPFSSTYVGFSSNVASFTDDWLISAPGLNGTAGTVVVYFQIDGTFAVDKNGTAADGASRSNTYAQASYAFGVGLAPNDVTATRRLRYDGTFSGTDWLGVVQEHTLNFTFGQSLNDVTLRISTFNVAAGEGGSYLSSTTTDLSAAMGGFGAVRDANGNLVTGYGFSSTSGTNYSQAVPEPATASLLLLAAAGFAGRRRVHAKA